MTQRIGLNGMTEENRIHYDMLMLSRAMPALVFRQWGKETPIPPRMGNSVNWRRLERPSANTGALTEGTPPSATNITVTAVTATVAQYGTFTRHSDILETQAIDPIVEQIVEMYGEHAGVSLDTIVRNVVSGGSTVQFASTATSRGDVGSGDEMTYAEIREAVATLENNDARPIAKAGGNFVGIIHPHTKDDLFGDSDFISTQQNAGPRGGANAMFTGQIGVFYGVNFLVTTQARIQTSLGLSGADVYESLFMGEEYFGVTEFSEHTLKSFIKPVGSGGTSDPLSQVGTIGWKASLAVARLNEAFAVRVEHTTSLGNQGT